MLAIIPARGGSKGLPRKNLRRVGGKTLIQCAVDAARGAGAVTRIAVSTDSPEIAEEALRAGAEVPFLRPEALAGDSTRTSEVISHMVGFMEQSGAVADLSAAVVLQPTTPLRNAGDVDLACEVFAEKNAETVVSVSKVCHPVEWLRAMDDQGALKSVMAGTGDQRRQEYEDVYLPNGAVFVLNREAIENGEYYGPRAYGYVMPPWRSVDIDNAFDLEIANLIAERERAFHAFELCV